MAIDVLAKPLQIVNNLTTTAQGFALDAYQGYWLDQHALHKTGDETIIAPTQFTKPITINNSLAAERSITCISQKTNATNPTYAWICLSWSEKPQFILRQYNNNGYQEAFIVTGGGTITNATVSKTWQFLVADAAGNNLLRSQNTWANNGVSIYLYRIANWVWLVGKGTTSKALSANHTFGTMHSAMRPLNSVVIPMSKGVADKSGYINITSGGIIKSAYAIASGTGVYFTTMYFNRLMGID